MSARGQSGCRRPNGGARSATANAVTRASYRETLRAVTRASAGPYGYTLTVWSSGMIAIDRLGHPHLAGVLLLAVGGVAGFLAVETLAHGSLAERVPGAPTARGQAFWANAHVLAIALAILAVWAVTAVTAAPIGWLLTGFLATSIYLAGNAALATLAARGEQVAAPLPDRSRRSTAGAADTGEIWQAPGLIDRDVIRGERKG